MVDDGSDDLAVVFGIGARIASAMAALHCDLEPRSWGPLARSAGRISHSDWCNCGLHDVDSSRMAQRLGRTSKYFEPWWSAFPYTRDAAMGRWTRRPFACRPDFQFGLILRIFGLRRLLRSEILRRLPPQCYTS